MPAQAWADLQFDVQPTAMLPPGVEDMVLGLFARSYREADAEYLRESMHHLANVSLAFHDGDLVAFALSSVRRLDLPRLGPQVVHLGGLACVAPDFRRRGLLVELSRLGMGSGPEAPRLACGRTAHPASFRRIPTMPGGVPKPGVRPTVWQQEVGRAIAGAYGVRRFEPETFVCVGRGRPIGHPVIDIDATPQEWELFRTVDRERGDSLLGIAWLDGPPPGW